MSALAVHTSGPYCAVRVDAGGRIAERITPMARGHAETLAAHVTSVLNDASLRPTELALIAVAAGPGGFAGTRVGVAFARGLALATGARAVGVLDLDAIAHMHGPQSQARVLAIHDAKRGDALWREYVNGAAIGPVQRGDIAAAQHAASLFRPDLICGSGARLVAEAAREGEVIEPGAPPLAAMIALARRAPKDAPRPAPFYARPPDAKLPGGVDRALPASVQDKPS